eukprot:scaffold111719_cov63-Phaeocystis_antarctica.AAC.3
MSATRAESIPHSHTGPRESLVRRHHFSAQHLSPHAVGASNLVARLALRRRCAIGYSIIKVADTLTLLWLLLLRDEPRDGRADRRCHDERGAGASEPVDRIGEEEDLKRVIEGHRAGAGDCGDGGDADGLIGVHVAHEPREAEHRRERDQKRAAIERRAQ